MATPNKYKSKAMSEVNSRTPIATTTEQKARIKVIIENFIKYLKLKHS
jgi:hypothetical protein